MAYTVTAYGSNNRSPQYKEYEIDTPDDLDTLPSQAEITAIGSLAHSKSNGVTYKLGNNRQWYALSDGGGSGLPESTAEDAGKVLTVGSTGAAEWASSTGDSRFISINFAVGANQTPTLDGITYAEIVAAKNDKKIPILYISSMLYGIGYFSSDAPQNSVRISAIIPNIYLNVSGTSISDAMLNLLSVIIRSDETVTAAFGASELTLTT